MTKKSATQTVVNKRAMIQVAISNLQIAPENMRAENGSDESLESLAGTIAANGILVPLHVRPPVEPETHYQILDGRRRFLALQSLVDAKTFEPSYLVDCLLIEDRNSQIATAYVTNTERLAASHADMVDAIVKLRSKKLSTAEIAKILGYRKKEIDQLDFIASADPSILAAMKAGMLGVTDARKIARVKNKEQQRQFAQRFTKGERVPAYEIEQSIKGNRVEQDSQLFAWVGEDAYIAAGGKLEQRLFDDHPAYVDPGILLEAANDTMAKLLADMNDELTQYVVDVAGDFNDLFDLADRTEPFPEESEPWTISRRLRELPTPFEFLQQGDREAAKVAFSNRLREHTRLMRWGAAKDLELTVVVTIAVDSYNPFTYDFYVNDHEYHTALKSLIGDVENETDNVATEGVALGEYRIQAPRGPQRDEAPDIAPVEVEGVTNILHFMRTAIAQAGLARDLADNPTAALVIVANELMSATLNTGHRYGETMSGLRVSQAEGTFDTIPSLDGVVYDRLNERKAEFQKSGKRQIEWIASLGYSELTCFIAELTAASLTLREPAKNHIRKKARADAAVIANMVGSNISNHWVPDSAYYGAHSKALIIEALEDMGAATPGLESMKKSDLVALAVREAESRQHAPACLSFRTATAADETADEAPDATVDGISGEFDDEFDMPGDADDVDEEHPAEAEMAS